MKRQPDDNWTTTNTYVCATCMYYVNFRCRRNAPTMKGYPTVYPTDFCGEHKISKDTAEKIFENQLKS